MSIRKVLEEAGRYQDVLQVIQCIINIDKGRHHPCNGKYVIGKLITNEAFELSKLILVPEFNKFNYKFDNLLGYVTEVTNFAMDYNANIPKHKQNNVMEEIIPWLILESMLAWFYIPNDDAWSIHDSCKKKSCIATTNVYVIEYSTCDKKSIIVNTEVVEIADSLDTAIKSAIKNTGLKITNIVANGDRVVLHFGETVIVAIDKITVLTKDNVREEM